MLWNDEWSNFHMAERFLCLWQVIRRAHQTLWDWTQTEAEVGNFRMISISPSSLCPILCPIFCTVIRISLPYFIKRMMNVRLSLLSSNYGISLFGFSSSSSSILARSSLGNSNPTRRAVRLTFSSCSIPTDGLYRSSNVCHQQIRQKIDSTLYVRWLRRYSRTSYPSAIRRSGADTLVSKTVRRWLWNAWFWGIDNARWGAGWVLTTS